MERKSNDYAVSDVIGTNLLILMTVFMFSFLLTTVFTIVEPDAEPPSADILCQVDDDNIILSHIGGESLSTNIKIRLLIGSDSTQEFLVDDYLDNDLKEDGWGFGESITLPAYQSSGYNVRVNLLDEESNTLIFSSIIPPPNPLITFINSISPYLQTISPLEITAVSTGSSPDNVSLWYKWVGYWEDDFGNNDTYVLDYLNMSFDKGDFVLVNVSGLGENIEDYVDNNISNVDVSSDKGYHSSFNNQKLKDSNSDTLTEENIGISGTTVLINSESFEGSWLPSGWSESSDWGWNKENDVVYDGSYSADYDPPDNSGYASLYSPVLDCSDATSINISFYFNVVASYESEFELYFKDEFGHWDNYEDLGTGYPSGWNLWQLNLIDSQYLHSDFQIRWYARDLENSQNEHIYIDLVYVTKESMTTNYELDLEVQWINADYDKTYEELCIYTVNLGDEDIIVDIWDGDSWETLFNDLSTGWNNISITTWLTSSTVTIRFKDGSSGGDVILNSWEIDAALIHIWDQTGEIFYEGNITSINIVKPADKNWSYFNADVNNTENCTFSIFDINNNLILGNLDGLNNDISIINNNIIRLHGSFDGPVRLNSWNVKYGFYNWSEYDTDITIGDGWKWNFNFPNGTGLYSFYSVGEKNGWLNEAAPINPDYDTLCYYKT